MRRYALLAVMALGLTMLCGCQKKYYGFGTPFTLEASKLSSYSNTEIANLSADNYERFMQASYIRVIDKYGNMQKVKISDKVARHNWNFENLDSSGMFKNYVDEDGSSKKVGVDVSEHQGVIDWETTSQYIDFAIIRLGYRGYTGGNVILDGYYGSNMAGATEHGVPVGVYFYSQAISYEEGVEEAQFVLSHCGDYDLSYPIILDVEDPMQDEARTNNLSVSEHTQAALGFLETIEAAGYKAMIYSNKMYYSLYLDINEIYQYPVWFAQYADEPDWPYEFSIWQYTEAGSVPGISGDVDMNIQMMDIQK